MDQPITAKISCVVTRYRDKIVTLASTLKRVPWVTALKPLGDKERKGFPPSSVQDLMHVGYQSNHETHPTSSPPPTTATPSISPASRDHGATVDWNVLIASPRGRHAGATWGWSPRPTPPPTERTHLFGSLMSNTDVTVTRTLMMSTAAGSRTMRTPEESGFAAEEAGPFVLFAVAPNIIFTR